MPMTPVKENGWLKAACGYSSESLEREIARLTRVSERRARVLVVDDMQTMRLLLGQALRGAGFTDVARAPDGEAALNTLREEGCDLALVDWNMPRMDGLELLDHVRSDVDLCDIVFIMVTGETLDERVIRAAEEKQDAYLTKPISPEKLTRRLDLILDKRLTTARAWQLAVQGDPEAAIEQLMTAAHNRPRAHWPLFELGELLNRHGRCDEAQRCYQRLLEVDPEALSAVVALGHINEQLGQVEKGRKLYRRALSANPQFFKAYDALAESLVSEGDHEGALKVLEGALKAQGSENALRQGVLGSLHYRLGQYSKAEASFAKALDLKPRQNAVENNLALGRSLLAQGLVKEAMTPLQKAVKKGAAESDQIDRVDAMLLMGAALVHSGELDRADDVFARMETPSLWPKGKVPFKANHLKREIGSVYLGAGMEEKAREYFVSSLCGDLDDEENRAALKALCLKAGRPDLAQTAQEDVRLLQDQEVEACSRRGLEMVKRGRYIEALEEYRKGLALDPRAGRLQFNLAKLYYRMKQPKDGMAAIAASAKLGLEKQDWELLVEVARILAGLRRREQAAAILRQVLNKEPNHSLAGQVLAEIERGAYSPVEEEGGV